jgi:uncharacterized NAD(P)/FAD-binding protein YdhS
MQSRIEDSNCCFTIAIIGGGFSGTCLAARLLRECGSSVAVVLIERGGSPGRGVAYGTRCSRHLLNVKAQNMSALVDDPEHFLRWLRLRHDANAQPGDYIPRQVYGQYVQSVLLEARAVTAAQFESRCDDAVAIKPVGGRAEIVFRSGATLLADKVIFALGNFPPANQKFPGQNENNQRYIFNPWSHKVLDQITQHGNVLLVGSGLTSVDLGISLRERGFEGKIHFLSRHGLLPQQHKAAQPWPAFWNEESPRTARGLLRLIRKQVSSTGNPANDWRAVIDSLRPFTHKIWRLLPSREQRRFLRHLRAYWDVHRHRVAPQIGEMLDAELHAETMQVHAGRIAEYSENADGIQVTYRDRHSGEIQVLRVDHVVNCTGPHSDIRQIDDPLLQDLLRNGIARADASSLGLETAQNGALLDARGVTNGLFYTLGPLRKGNLWESTAVPEIRAQAAELAVYLAAGLRKEDETKRPLAHSSLEEWVEV